MENVNSSKASQQLLGSGEVKRILVEQLAMLRKFAWSLTGDKADADDLVQALAEKVLLKGLPAQVNPAPWLLKMCKNLWIDEIRARKVRRTDLNENRTETIAFDGEAKMINQLSKEQVMSAMAGLSDSHRSVLALVTQGGLSYAEAAELEGVPVGTIMSRIARARQNLSSILNTGSAEGQSDA